MELGETAPFEIDDSYTAVKKSDAPQDIDRLTFDEKLDEVEKTAACLGSSNIFQQIFALVSFPRLLRNAQLKPRALALLTESNLGFLSSGKTELMIAAAQSFTEILDSAVLCPVELDQHLFPVLQNAYLNRLSALDPVVSLLWRELFVEMMRQLAVSVLRGKVLQIVLSKSQYSQPTHNRTLAANTVGILCELLDHETVEQELFAQAMCLCQDTDYEVRAIMCGQLPQIARAVSADLVNKRILEELLDLVGDEILEVRLQAVDTMISMCDVFETEIRATQILPIVKQICRNVSDDVSLTLAANFGLLACKLSADLVADGDSLMIFETFKGLAKNPDSTCRKHCAFNFPAMVKTSGAAKFAVHLLDTLVALSADEAVPVRQTIAAGIHEIALILGGQRSITHLKPVIITLFTDSSMAVCEAVVPKVGVILGVLRSDDSGEPQQALWHEMLSPLLALQTTVEHKWRVHLPLLKQWRGLPDWYTNRNDIYEHFVPVLLTAMNAAPNVVAQEAASVLCLCIRRNNFDFQQRAMCQRILREFGRASRWSLRMLFLDFCEMVMTTFSRRFFRTHFLDHILMMDTDRVPNVRKRLAQLLPAIAEALPPNSIHSEKLEGILECFHQDRDRDVVETTTWAQEQIVSRPLSAEDDEIDRRKELEEDGDSKAEAAMHSLVQERRNISRGRTCQLSGSLAEKGKKPAQISSRRSLCRKLGPNSLTHDPQLDKSDRLRPMGRRETTSAPNLQSLVRHQDSPSVTFSNSLISNKTKQSAAARSQRRHSASSDRSSLSSERRANFKR